MSIDLFVYSGNVPEQVSANRLNDWFVGKYTNRRHTYRELLCDITEYDYASFGCAKKTLRDFFFKIWQQSNLFLDKKVSLSDFNNVYFEVTSVILTDLGSAITSHKFGDFDVEESLMQLVELIGVEFDYGNRVFIMMNW